MLAQLCPIGVWFLVLSQPECTIQAMVLEVYTNPYICETKRKELQENHPLYTFTCEQMERES